jgi:hypothetical protein
MHPGIGRRSSLFGSQRHTGMLILSFYFNMASSSFGPYYSYFPPRPRHLFTLVGFCSFRLIFVSLLDRSSTVFPLILPDVSIKIRRLQFLLPLVKRSASLSPPFPPPLGTRHTTVIMKTSLVLLGSLASLGLAVPTQTISYQWSPELAEFYSAVDNHIQKARARGLTLQPPTCDLSNAVMPVAPTPLPTPAPGLILREVAIGRGVQVRAPPQPPLCRHPHTDSKLAELHLRWCLRTIHPSFHRCYRLSL